MGAAEGTRILAISPGEDDFVSLQHVFSHSNWKLERARALSEALTYLQENETAVVISACDLPDASWRKALAEFASQPHPPRLIVYAASADERLWAEVLDQGGYDVLTQPFEAPEVMRVVSLAWRQWKEEGVRHHRSPRHGGGRVRDLQFRNPGNGR